MCYYMYCYCAYCIYTTLLIALTYSMIIIYCTVYHYYYLL